VRRGEMHKSERLGALIHTCLTFPGDRVA
jgi:hypothetical protein